MKIILLSLAFGAACIGNTQDLKEASSEQTSIMEGRLRDTRPAIEKILDDGTSLAIWTLTSVDTTGSAIQYLAKATAKSEIPTANEGTKSVRATFNYNKGALCGVNYKQTTIVQNPAPMVKNSAWDLVYANGLQTSPTPGSLPEVEKFIDEVAANIEKSFQSYVNSK